jgi:hypothetical protein
VVDPETNLPCPADAVGEIWIDGSTTPPGYWRHSAETARVFGARLASGEGPLLRTGDLGFLHDGILYVTGRIKDMIVVRGQNVYPQDLEASARAAVPDAPEAAAFALDGSGTERPALVIERPRGVEADPQALLAAIREAVWLGNGIELELIVLTQRRALPKTSSGKLQRSAARAALIDGSLPVLAEWRADDPAAQGDAAAETRAMALVLDLRRLTRTEQRGAIEDYLAGIVCELLGVPADGFDRSGSLITMGVTSLGIMRLKRRVEADLMITLDSRVLWQESGVADLSVHLHRAVLASTLWANAEVVERLTAEIACMSDEQVARELAAQQVA